MNTLYKTLSLYLPKATNKNLRLPSLYAFNGKKLINLYSYNKYYKIIEYDVAYSDDKKELMNNKIKKMFVSTFIKKGYRIIYSYKKISAIYSKFLDDDLPF